MSDATTVSMGIDLGGTGIKGGLVRADGSIVEKRSMATEADRGPDHVIGRMAAMIDELGAAAQAAGLKVAAVGLGVPGTLSHAHGVVIAPPNLPGWRDVPIVQRLGAATGRRVTLENDANAAAWGEYVCGAGRGTRTMALITLGTGVGGGLIIDGSLYRGSADGAGEIGHMVISPGGRLCACGQRGCLEAYVSARSTVLRAMERIAAGEATSLSRGGGGGGPAGELTAEDVEAAAAAGDALAESVWSETCDLLATACVNLQHLLNPERIVLGGGMSGAGGELLVPVRAATKRLISPTFGRPPEIVLAALGSDAGIVGAALSVDLAN